MKAKTKGTIVPLEQSQFDALPLSIQRKYFSSLERLQIQQQSFEEPTSGRSSQASSSTPFRPSRSLGTRRRRRKAAKAVQDHDISHSEIDFFLSLPEKVRKQHFSREEQVLLQGTRDQAFLPDEQYSEWAQQRFDDFHFDLPRTSVDILECGRSRRPSSASTLSPENSPFFLPTEKEKEDDRISRLYLEMMSTPVFSTKERPTVDMRRTMSLTAHPNRPPTSPAMFISDPPIFTFGPNPRHRRAHSSSLSGRRSFHTPTTPIFDSEATHYQDPEARKKLRMYLASPQKFDEAIEFGFPSTAANDAATPHFQLPQIDSHARKFSRDMHTFLRDGQLSFFEDNITENQGLESDADSLADMESPTTPSSTGLSFRLHSRQLSPRKFSVESPAPSPVHSANGQLNREMTLRMTLTRPDLRADEDQLYGWQGSSASPKPPKDDPLALEDLVLTDDMTGTRGAFYVKPKARDSLVTRLLKRASWKAR
ncbi:hypothetical protein EJ02DRAFT_454984 [Clathrospora elynae]|uniref:Mucin-like protein n=1 Tax=Clathrospora elynae TaxID=706981 RepID=A0A6A5SQ04_9PLEO|nr:hypothetical protein EJ02DRAFT_454984 [Clathrospora elynae]